jgi:hypothetical protein
MSLANNPTISEATDRLLRASVTALFDDLPERVRVKLTAEFMESFDAADLEESVFCHIDNDEGRNSDLSLRFSRRWESFLERADILNAHRGHLQGVYEERFQ